MPIAYKKIATATVGAGGVANVEFTSIDQTFTDLVVHACARSTRTGFPVDDMVIRFNGSTTGYNTRRLYAVGTGISNDNVTSDLRGFVSDADSTASAFGSNIFYIPNYTAATNKSVHIDGVGETNATNAGLVLAAGLWQNTAAITTIRLFANNGDLVQHSTFTLYGISKS